MEFEYMTSHEFKHLTEATPANDIDDGQKKKVEILRRVEAIAGAVVNVITDGGADNMVACYSPSSAQIFIREEMLTQENLEFALYAAAHEKMHAHNNFCHLQIKEDLSSDQIKTIEAQTGIPDLAGINLIEGFNDLITKEKYGRSARSGYKDVEVPAAEKLEKLALQEIGVSLKEAFHQGNQALFTARLVQLSEHLLFKMQLETVQSLLQAA